MVLGTNQIRDENGTVVDDHLRPETMAKYFEEIQWKVRPDCIAHNRPALYDDDLQMQVGPVTIQELRQAIKKFKNHKASGMDDIPIELWKIIASNDNALQHLADICSTCWTQSKKY